MLMVNLCLDLLVLCCSLTVQIILEMSERLISACATKQGFTDLQLAAVIQLCKYHS